MADISERAQAEKDRMTSILVNTGTSQARLESLEPMLDNVAWIKIKLDDARAAIKNSQIAIPYDNGGGQTGVRENPLFKGYEALFKTYMSGIQCIFATLPEEVAAETQTNSPKTVLELVRARHTA